MKWSIPAKTFLLGEYAAINEASAILLTTTPYFELSLTTKPNREVNFASFPDNNEHLSGIHPQSPAGILWRQINTQETHELTWHDPYQGRGGLGASSAQFLGCYLAICHLHHKIPNLNDMLKAYHQSAWSGTGLRPSGYDVIAQSQQGCVYINKQKNVIKTYDWPFKDLSFFLLHTGVKLATHHHLQETTLPSNTDLLSTITDQAKEAFEQQDSKKLIDSINKYHQMLIKLQLVAPHTLDFIQSLLTIPELLAIKGCGALGADILLLVCARKNATDMKEKLLINNWSILATEENLMPNKMDFPLITRL